MAGSLSELERSRYPDAPYQSSPENAQIYQELRGRQRGEEARNTLATILGGLASRTLVGAPFGAAPLMQAGGSVDPLAWRMRQYRAQGYPPEQAMALARSVPQTEPF